MSIFELLNEVAAATEDLDEDYINELKPLVANLKASSPNCEHIETMEKWIEKAEDAIDCSKEYESTKAGLIPELIAYYKGLPNTAPIAEMLAEEQADEMAWDLVYR